MPCPLPFPALLPHHASHLSRCVQRRLQAKRAWQSWCNEGMAAVNEIYGHGGPPLGDCSASASAAQLSCIQHFAEQYRRVGKPPADVPSAAGAFEELCGSRPGYSSFCDAESGTHAPFRDGDVSYPPPGSMPVDPVDLFKGADLAQWKGWRDHILRDDLSVEAAQLAKTFPSSMPTLTQF